MKNKSILLLVGALMSQSAPAAEPAAGAENLPKQVTIQQLLQIVREKSPRYALAKNRIESAKAEVTAADVLPNPRVTYGRYDQAGGKWNTQFDGPSQQQVMLEIPMLVAGQRGARKAAAERRVDLAEAEVETDYTHLIREVWRVFVELLAKQEQAAVLENAQQELEHLRTIIAAKEQAGMASRYDVLRITQETRGLETKLADVRTDAAGLTGALDVLLGFPNWKPEVSGKLAPLGAPTDTKQLWRLAEQHNPELQSVARATVAADADLDRAERERWPVPSLQLGTAFTDRPFGNAVYAGVAVDIPLFDRGQGGMARASAEKQAARLKRDLLLSVTRQDLERAVEVLARRRATLTKFEQEVLAPLPVLQQMSEDAYRLGKAGVLELLDASRTHTETRLNHLVMLTDAINAELDVLSVTGLLARGDDYCCSAQKPSNQ